MPTIKALLHTHNDALRLGRCLELLHPCDEVLVMDHGSTDGTVLTAREYGARIVAPCEPSGIRESIGLAVSGEWILCLEPRESLTESLVASLFEWKKGAPTAPAYSVYLREEVSDGWFDQPQPQVRLIPGNWDQWAGHLPSAEKPLPHLEGSLLRFSFP